MRQPTGGTAGQHQADFRAWRFNSIDEEREQTQKQAGQQAAHHESRSWAIKAGIIATRSAKPVTPGTCQIMSASKPEIVITYCTQCQWLLRAAWLAQELLSTFADDLGRVALEPATGGAFRITCDGVQIWERKVDGGFPEAKVLKQRVRDQIDPQRDLGHNDRTQ
jgi:selenoprotein W-related protein